jgi:hypothetical protein
MTYVHATDFLERQKNRGRRHDECRRLPGLLEQARPRIRTGYPQHIRFRSMGNVTVSEVKTEEIRIRGLFKGPPVASRAVRWRFPHSGTPVALSPAITVPPVPDGPDGHAADLGVFSI